MCLLKKIGFDWSQIYHMSMIYRLKDVGRDSRIQFQVGENAITWR